MYRILLLSVVFIFSSCGFFSDNEKDDPFDVEIKESFDIEFEFDAADICPSGQDCTVKAEPSPDPVDFPELTLPQTIDILALTQSTKLRELAKRLKKVEIESIDYELIDNTLNVPSPEFLIFIGPPNVLGVNSNGTVELASVPSLPPMTSKKGTSPAKTESLPVVSDLFKALKFTAIAHVDYDLKKGDLFPVQGKVKYKITFNVRFVANPLEQLKK